MTTPESQSSVIERLRGELMTLLTRIEGDVRLVLAQLEHTNRRTDEVDDKHTRRADGQDRKLDGLDARLDQVEATRPTRADMVRMVSLIVTVAGVATTIAVAVITALIK